MPPIQFPVTQERRSPSLLS